MDSERVLEELEQAPKLAKKLRTKTLKGEPTDVSTSALSVGPSEARAEELGKFPEGEARGASSEAATKFSEKELELRALNPDMIAKIRPTPERPPAPTSDPKRARTTR